MLRPLRKGSTYGCDQARSPARRLPGLDPPHREDVGEVIRLSTGVALAQGLWVRGRIEVLPPAGGPLTGRMGGVTEAAALRLGILGESTAAGCGAEVHETAFAGALARRLAASGPPVDWRVVGEHGATARRIRHRLLPQLLGDFDVVVILAGANDVLARRSPEQWGEDLAAIVAELSRRSSLVVVTGTPPFFAFPSLPTTLARFLTARGQELDAVSHQVCAGVANSRFVATAPRLVRDGFFARDGFHPGERGYRHWADLVADTLLNR
ncbi:G-D-S-L family lipolytic protein [Enemella evansiae]|uniref:G-D-S-L family lipolytic protein n=1 Tax=Enemella evansiae TaxID=2016499 RepID=A0A255GFJ9_9ACTN|nr:G-D-S-L family lipolytic protein [Enemella evansiae]